MVGSTISKKNVSWLFFASLLLFSPVTQAQSINVPPNLDGTQEFPFTNIDRFVNQDTSAQGSQNHSTYLLERGGVYFFDCEVDWDFDVTLKAHGDAALGRPFVRAFSGLKETTILRIYKGGGSLRLDGLYIVLGERGPSVGSYVNRSLRFRGSNKRYVIQNCILEKAGEEVFLVEGEGNSIYLMNNQIRNIGDFQVFAEKGSIINSSGTFTDSIVIHKNVMHNMVDRIFKGNGIEGLNYFKFTNNTIFNHLGRNGLVQLNNTKETVIKDNLFMNPSMFGTSKALSNEQITFKDSVNFLFTLDSIVEGASIEMSNNNVFWSEDVQDHYQSLDAISQPPILSPQFSMLLENPDDAYYGEVLTLGNVPSREILIQYLREAISYPDSVGITDIMVEVKLFEGSEFDNGNIFDFSHFDPCFDGTTTSASAASDGGPVGVRFICDQTLASDEVGKLIEEFTVAPNPMKESTNIYYSIQESSFIDLSVYTAYGRKICTMYNGFVGAGKHSLHWKIGQDLTPGLYYVKIQSTEGQRAVSLVLH